MICTSSCAASAWTSAQTGRPNSSPVLRAASGIVSATAAARNPGIAPNSRRQKRPKAPQPSRPTPSFVPDVSVLVDVFMALELSRKELRLRARHPAAAHDQRVVQPRAVDLTVTSPEALVYWHVETGAVCIYSQLRSFSSSEVAAMIEPGSPRHRDASGEELRGFARAVRSGVCLLSSAGDGSPNAAAQTYQV